MTDPGAEFEALPPDMQAEVAERLLKIRRSGWRPFWCKNGRCDGNPHKGFDYQHARVDQRLPPWRTPWNLFILSGRGAGKTRTGAEVLNQVARRGVDQVVVGRRGVEVENTLVNGPSGILACAHPEFVPEYWASKDLLVWPNGAKTYLFSAERPDNIRSINVGFAWVDEAAFMDEIETVWSNIKFANRIGDADNPPHVLVTTTPVPTKWMIAQEDDPRNIIRRVSTYENRANLSAEFIAEMEEKYEGTRLGRQELHGEVLRDVEGALWNDDLFRHSQVLPEEFDRIVVSLDPAGTKSARSDETGIVVVGRAGREFWVLQDDTGRYSPAEWARRALVLVERWGADAVVAEKNYGGDMVAATLESVADAAETLVRVRTVVSRKGKRLRAEPVVGLYEQGRVWHYTGGPAEGPGVSAIEDEMIRWVPGVGPSPNRVDAVCQGITDLAKGAVGPVSVALPPRRADAS